MNIDGYTPEQRDAALAVIAQVEARTRGDEEALSVLAPETPAETMLQLDFARTLLADWLRR